MNVSPDKRIAGILAPLFALRRNDDLGIGDLAALLTALLGSPDTGTRTPWSTQRVSTRLRSGWEAVCQFTLKAVGGGHHVHGRRQTLEGTTNITTGSLSLSLVQ